MNNEVVEEVKNEAQYEEEHVNMSNGGNTGKAKLIILIGVVIVVLGILFFVFFGSSFSKNDKNKEDNSVVENEDVAGKFEGIYRNNETTLFIKKVTNNTISYTIDGGGFFQGIAKVENNIASETSSVRNEEKFVFTYSNNAIDVSYSSEEESMVAVDLGMYNRVADYNDDNLYTYAVGDASYLTSKYNGFYSNGDITMAVFQTSASNVKVAVYKNDTLFFDELFELKGENNLVAYSIFDEENCSYEIIFDGESFQLIVHDDVFGIGEDEKKLEATYTRVGEITKDQILDEFYIGY